MGMGFISPDSLRKAAAELANGPPGRLIPGPSREDEFFRVMGRLNVLPDRDAARVAYWICTGKTLES